MTARLRMKAKIDHIKHIHDHAGVKCSEEVALSAVYGDTGPNKQWCKWTPCIQFNFTISNPGAFGAILPGEQYYIDLIPTTADDPA